MVNIMGVLAGINCTSSPSFEAEARGILDWNNSINPLAVAIKCAWRVTTVSPSYLDELKQSSNGLEHLISHEQHKSIGILNGIDSQVWDPRTDPYIDVHLGDDMAAFKQANKQILGQHFRIDFANANCHIYWQVGERKRRRFDPRSS